MRPAPVLVTLALAAVACHESPTEAPGPVPSGLTVTLGISPVQAFTRITDHATSRGDSVVATATLGISGCNDYKAVAGNAGDALVVTFVATTTQRICSMDARAAVFRAVVHPAPRGGYDVVVRDRIEGVDDGPIERELARWPVFIR